MECCHLHGVLSKIPNLNGTITTSLEFIQKAKVQSKEATPYTIPQTILPDEDYDYLSDVLVKPISYLQGYPKVVDVVEPLFDSTGNVILDSNSNFMETSVVYVRKY